MWVVQRKADIADDWQNNQMNLPSVTVQVDPEVFAALPAELQAELKDAYDQRQKQPEQQPANAFGEYI